MIRAAGCGLVLATLVGCGEAAEVAPLEAYKDPTTGAPINGWKLLEVHGDAPGHADSIRFIYANPIANGSAPALPPPEDAEFPDIGLPLGSVLVKEVYADDDGELGELRHIAIMRRLRHVNTPLRDQGGWVFTEVDKPEDPETSYDFCWQRCHASAPYNGAWYDYGQLP